MEVAMQATAMGTAAAGPAGLGAAAATPDGGPPPWRSACTYIPLPYKPTTWHKMVTSRALRQSVAQLLPAKTYGKSPHHPSVGSSAQPSLVAPHSCSCRRKLLWQRHNWLLVCGRTSCLYLQAPCLPSHPPLLSVKRTPTASVCGWRSLPPPGPASILRLPLAHTRGCGGWGPPNPADTRTPPALRAPRRRGWWGPVLSGTPLADRSGERVVQACHSSHPALEVSTRLLSHTPQWELHGSGSPKAGVGLRDCVPELWGSAGLSLPWLVMGGSVCGGRAYNWEVLGVQWGTVVVVLPPWARGPSGLCLAAWQQQGVGGRWLAGCAEVSCGVTALGACTGLHGRRRSRLPALPPASATANRGGCSCCMRPSPRATSQRGGGLGAAAISCAWPGGVRAQGPSG